MKKICRWIVFITISLNFGCGLQWIPTKIKRNNLSATFPNAQALIENIDREEAINDLREVVGASTTTFQSPSNLSTRPIVTMNGFQYHVKLSKVIDTSYTTTGVGRYSKRKITTTWRTWQERRVMEWQNIQSLRVHKDRFFGDPSTIFVLHVESSDTTIKINLRSEEQRDQAIASLLTLCPNVE